jgi:large-conductance mechanosensitive channel
VEQAYVRITSYHDRTLDRYVVLKNIFQDLLNFLIADEVITLSIQAINKLTFKSNEKEDLSESKQINSIQILYSSTISEKMDKLSIKQPYLFQYGEIKEQFSKIVRKWFDLKKNWFCL